MTTAVLARRLARLEELVVPSTAELEARMLVLAPAVMSELHTMAAGTAPPIAAHTALGALCAALAGVRDEDVYRLLQPLMAGLDLDELRSIACRPGDDDHDERIVSRGERR